MSEERMETWQTKTDCATVRIGETQADVAVWANGEGVTVAVTGKFGTSLLACSLCYEQMEALCAAYALLKARGV